MTRPILQNIGSSPRGQNLFGLKPVDQYSPAHPFFELNISPRTRNPGPYENPVARGLGMALGPGIFAGVLANLFTVVSALYCLDVLNREKTAKVPGKKGRIISKESPEYGPWLALTRGFLYGAFNVMVKSPYSSFGEEVPNYSPRPIQCSQLISGQQLETSVHVGHQENAPLSERISPIVSHSSNLSTTIAI